MKSILEELKKLFQKDERLVSEGEILKNKIIELALKMDKDKNNFFSDRQMSSWFFD